MRPVTTITWTPASRARRSAAIVRGRSTASSATSVRSKSHANASTCAGNSGGRISPLGVAGDGGDVRRDVVDLLLGELPLERRHRAGAVRHALVDELGVRLRLVEVGADGAGRAGVGERVAGGAPGGGEDGLARGRVALGAATRLRA